MVKRRGFRSIVCDKLDLPYIGILIQYSLKQGRADAAPLKLRAHQNILYKNDRMPVPYHAGEPHKRRFLIGRYSAGADRCGC